MTKRFLFCLLVISVLFIPVQASTIRWVDFAIPYESLKYAMDVDIETKDMEKHISWIEILAVAGCRTGGKCGLQSVKTAANDLKGDNSPEELLGKLYKHYPYYYEAYEAVLGGLLGNFSIEINGQKKFTYGLKAFSPIAAGYGYSIALILVISVLSALAGSTWVMI